MRTTIFFTLFLGLAACDDKADAPAKTAGKTETTKKSVKVPPAKAENKADPKGDTKADAKADPGKDPDAPPPETPPDPSSDEAAKIVELARLARAIAATPEEADTILEKAGMDRTAFETQMLAVAKDQWRTDLYLTALAGADRAATGTGAG
jgi:hypothetical protein